MKHSHLGNFHQLSQAVPPLYLEAALNLRNGALSSFLPSTHMEHFSRADSNLDHTGLGNLSPLFWIASSSMFFPHCSHGNTFPGPPGTTQKGSVNPMYDFACCTLEQCDTKLIQIHFKSHSDT